MEQSTRKIVFTIGIFLIFAVVVKGTPCNLRWLPTGSVCVCNETYCDSYDDITLRSDNEYILATTSEAGHRFHVERGHLSDYYETVINVHDINEDETFELPNFVRVDVEPRKRYQKIFGFGGAFTGSVSYILERLPMSMQHYLYKSYYSETDGNNFNLMRLIIGGCDFDLKPWSYAETPENDTTLSGFTELFPEDLQKIRQIKELERITRNYLIKRIGAAWTSPRWMKDSYDWTGKNRLQPRYQKAWAEYYLRWLRLMRENDMEFWGISTGNEPLNGIENYEIIKFVSLGLTAADQGSWIGRYLGPMIRSSEFKNIKIIGNDDQLSTLPWWFKEMDIAYPNSTSYIDGIGYHWYQEGLAPYSYIDDVHKQFPEKLLFLSESCIGVPIILGSWNYTERYIKSFFNNFNHDNQGWMIWNLWLNEKGQPNYINHADNAAIMVNTTSNREFYKNPWFYTIGHFSKFLVPDSVRIDVKSDNDKLYAIGFERPDSALVIILYNESPDVIIAFIYVETKKIQIRVPAKTMHTLTYKPKNTEWEDCSEEMFS